MLNSRTPPRAQEIPSKLGAISRRRMLGLLISTSLNSSALGPQPTRAASAGVEPVTIWARESLYHRAGSAYFAQEAQWGAAGLTNLGPAGRITDPAREYIDRMTVDSVNFPSNTVCEFQYPPSNRGVYSYPNINYGRNQYNNPPALPGAPAPAQVANLTELTIDYKFMVDDSAGGRFAVIHDIWLNSIANAGLNDRMFEIDFVCFVQHGMSFGGKYMFTVADTGPWDGQPVHSSTFNWRVLGAQMNVSDGRVNVLGLLKQMMWHGLATGNEWIMGTSMGPEAYGGTGAVTINTYKVTWAAAPNITIAGNAAYAVTPGSNHIVGTALRQGCAVVYPKPAGTYQVRRILQNILVRTGTDNLTLDVLQGIDYLQFSDGRKAIADMPLVSDCIFAISLPLTAGMVVGTVPALGNPTSWSIIKGDPMNYFAISSSGELSVTRKGAKGGINLDSKAAQIVTLEVEAKNGAGSDIGILKIGRVMFTTLDAPDKSVSLTLSGGNLVATAARTSPNGDIARAAVTELFGKYYCEATVTRLDGSGSWAIGLVNGKETLTDTAIGSSPASIGAYADSSGGVIKINNVALVQNLGGNASSGDVVGLAVDLDHQRIWFRLNGGNWNNSPTAEPSMNLGGIDISSVQQFHGANRGGPRLSPAVYLRRNGIGASATLNFGQSPFSFYAPKGFGPWLNGM